jgi:hypothetical protein
MLPNERSYSVWHVEYIQVVVMSLFRMCKKKGNFLNGTKLDNLLHLIINTRWLREPAAM